MRTMSCCWCHVLARMWISAVGEGACSTKIFQVQDWRAMRRLLTPLVVRSLSHDSCSRTALIVYQHFEQQAKSSADMLHSLLTFHCSSRDSLTCENMVSNWSVIAFWTETVRKRSPQTVVFVKKCSHNFRLYCRTVASSWISRRAEQ